MTGKVIFVKLALRGLLSIAPRDFILALSAEDRPAACKSTKPNTCGRFKESGFVEERRWKDIDSIAFYGFSAAVLSQLLCLDSQPSLHVTLHTTVVECGREDK